ncbi:dephospho-CoA kinase [Devosia limi DSM 17137]|uniref:Dephospho-CoA kinase n=1 Tax=Devosia limi DSM 17137 TaxID=1121477 RepID=A0A0F5L1E4_9HYPH|nr:dephospho-CoA kinase [Devosia limi]KKB76236.1 dephospho-CoA kinase [Devosia limi DSM 17137]SHF18157.1 dephospho-CoA kinase [Devosia limi DSM 17137]
MWRIGITGSIATGKSTVLDAFRTLGVPVFSADAAVAELYAGEAVAAVEALFPGVAIDGVIDRNLLAQRLAADPSGFKRLEAVVHPLVRARIKDFMDKAEQSGAALAVVEVPLLFESGYDYGFDAVGVTFVDEAIQRQRVLARPGMTVEKLDTILARQLPQAEKKARATYLFDTGGTLAQTQAMVRALVAAIQARQGQQ